MPRIGVTGHTNLTPATVTMVERAIRAALAPYAGPDLTGVSCLARGADTIFASAVVDLGGCLDVVLPSADYRARKVAPDHAATFDALTRRARTVRVMPFTVAGRAAYEAANETLLASCDRLLAVWDGQAAADRGGTAAVVALARGRGLPVEVIWPDGASRC